jgi:hypothetical protein
LNISGGFPNDSNPQYFGVDVMGITNPFAANTYSYFSVQLLFPNGSI